MYWKIKSRNTWLMTGDRNTKYFHSTAKTRRVRNRVISIQDSNGVIRKGDQNIAAVAQDYFQGLFTSSPASSTCYEEIFQGFQSRVTKDMNVDLTKEVSIKEIRKATFSIGPSKALGPDGFTGDFYQQFWSEISTTVIRDVQNFFRTNYLDLIHNHTNLCLIPKVAAPSTMLDFRPIALCNVSYKIISKILVNRLEKHLSGIIKENQAAFIPGRMITDNIIISHEIYYSLKRRKRQSNSYMDLKTDITKAYNRLEWSFLEQTMKHMGFNSK